MLRLQSGCRYWPLATREVGWLPWIQIMDEGIQSSPPQPAPGRSAINAGRRRYAVEDQIPAGIGEAEHEAVEALVATLCSLGW